MMAKMNWSSSFWGSWYCSCQLTGTFEKNRDIVNVIIKHLCFSCYDESKCLLWKRTEKGLVGKEDLMTSYQRGVKSSVEVNGSIFFKWDGLCHLSVGHHPETHHATEVCSSTTETQSWRLETFCPFYYYNIILHTWNDQKPVQNNYQVMFYEVWSNLLIYIKEENK